MMDVASEDDETPEKIRYAMYATLDEAKLQAQHELATPTARDRMRKHHGNDDLELYPSGVRILRVEDETGKLLWKP